MAVAEGLSLEYEVRWVGTAKGKSMRSEGFQAFVKTSIVAALVIAGAAAVVWLSPPGHIGSRDEPVAQRVSCVNNLKQIGLSFRTWAIDHEDQFPFNLSTNAGGSKELCVVGNDGFDRSASLHFQVMSNDLNTPRLLICPQDRSKKAATNFVDLEARKVTYLMRSGTNLSEANTPREVLIVCPIDGNILYCDGTVEEAKK